MSYKNLAEEIRYKKECTGTGLEKVTCIISVFSSVGHTPITKRGGAYCDLLLREEIVVESRHEAQELANKYLKETKDAASSSFYMPKYWNHNLRGGNGTKLTSEVQK